VVKKFIDELNSLLKDRNVHVKPTVEAVEYLIAKGFDKKMGARPLQRTIDELIKKPLSKEILFGKLTNGGIVEVGANADGLTLNFVEVLPIVEKTKDEDREAENQ
jgi:ATP-dependent Clp protease ATP-binding subunit ClpA